LAKYLYFKKSELGERFLKTNIIPPIKDAWDLPELKQPNEFYSGQHLGQLYADLAPDVPPVYISSLQRLAEKELERAYARAFDHFKAHGLKGIKEVIREALRESADYVRESQARQDRLVQDEL
jgi:arabinosaccharide transport system substrate-binding protein